MALRNQPYFPLYVQDFLTDEKLAECSASATGVYIRLICILHKSSTYGSILLKQKDKQNESNIENFANKLVKLMPYDAKEIEEALIELTEENVITIEEDELYQKRMVNDGIISDKRSLAGKKGIENKKQNDKQKIKFAKDFVKAKRQANSENEIVIENENEINNNLFNFIEQEFGRTLSPTEYEVIESWEDNELTRYAIRQAILNGAPRIKYIQTILDSYKTKNIKSVQEAQKDEEDYKKSKKQEINPEWIDKKIEKAKISADDEAELKELLKEFK